MIIHPQPVFANGKICYLEIPAIDITKSASFYADVFGWKIRDRGNGDLSFDDTAGQVSGIWVTNRVISDQPGIMISLMVYDIRKTSTLIIGHGGRIVNAHDEDAPQKVCTFADPAGNIFCLYEDKSSIDSMTTNGI